MRSYEVLPMSYHSVSEEAVEQYIYFSYIVVFNYVLGLFISEYRLPSLR